MERSEEYACGNPASDKMKGAGTLARHLIYGPLALRRLSTVSKADDVADVDEARDSRNECYKTFAWVTKR